EQITWFLLGTRSVPRSDRRRGGRSGDQSAAAELWSIGKTSTARWLAPEAVGEAGVRDKQPEPARAARTRRHLTEGLRWPPLGDYTSGLLAKRELSGIPDNMSRVAAELIAI